MMEETWKPVVGFEGAYEVSNLGRVRSLDRFVRCGPDGTGQRLIRGKLLKGYDDTHGYLQVDLCGASSDVEDRPVKIYRLVAEAFHGLPPTPQHVANHINGKKRDDRAENLEWITQGENMAHAARTGLISSGSNHYSSKVTEDDVRQMREMRQQGFRCREIGEKFGISTSTVATIVNGTWWKHAPLADYVPPPASEWRRGEKAFAAKLTEEKVREIKRLYATGEFTQKQLGEMFGVTSVSISSVIIGKTWAHVMEVNK